jgi:hypothetical protein
MPVSIQLHLRFAPLLAVVFFLCSLFPGVTFGQFPINPAANVPISTAFDGQSNPVIVGDGAGGAFIAWNDLRTGQGFDIYMQHINAQGFVQWDTNGIVISAESGIQDMVVMVSDGAGGAILAWEDKRTDVNFDIYAQRINSSGSALWAAGGIPVITADGDQETPSIISDNQGGAIIAWNDTRPNAESNIYAQRIDASGNLKWAAGGIPILKATVSSIFDPPSIVRDGNHGAVIGWVDARNSDGSTDIYVQHVDANGTCTWDTAGTAACLDPANQAETRLAPDGSGGVIVGWTDWRAQSRPDGVYGDDGIYAQHIDSAGIARWTKDGVKVCDTTDRQESGVVVTDDAGGAIFAWDDKRKGTEYDIYAQRVDSTGAFMWDSSGIPVCTAFGDQGDVRMISDSTGGALIAWGDNRVGNVDIYATRISGKGIALWPSNGVAITTADGQKALGHMIFNKKRGGIIAWTDGRGGSAGSSNIYAQNVDLNGHLGLAPTLASPQNDVVLSADSVRLVWYPLLPKPARYWLELGLDSTFTFRSTDSTITDTTYLWKNLASGKSFWWKIRGYDDGFGPFSEARKLSVGTGVSGIESEPDVPKVFALGQNYPNPFNPATRIKYTVAGTRGSAIGTRVNLVLYDVLGREVITLVNEEKAPGYYEVTLDASKLASGLYIYQMTAGTFVQSRKMLLLK